MKKIVHKKSFTLLLLIFFVLIDNCISQELSSTIFHFDSLPARLNGWKFHAGDDPQWAKTEYDDKDWQSINPSLELHKLPIVKNAGIGWFRLKIKVDSSFMKEQIAMVYSNIGASEIYLNGELKYKFGTVSSDFNIEKTQLIRFRPYSLKLGNQPVQQLAVRYSFHRKNLYSNFMRTNTMRMVFKENNKAFADYLRGEGFVQNLRSIRLTFYLPLGCLLLFLYFSYRPNKEYLYFGFFCISLFLATSLHLLGIYETRTVTAATVYGFGYEVFAISGLVALLNGTYILFKQHKGPVYYFLLLSALVYLPACFWFPDWLWIVGNLFQLMVIIEAGRLSLNAFRRQRPGAIILLFSSILCLLLTILSTMAGFTEIGYVLVTLSFVVAPIALSLFFAGEFARTSRTLQQKVVDVEQLSEKTIAQEKEKQQILALQTEILEEQVKEKTVELIEQQQVLEAEKEAKLIEEFNRKFSESELKALRAQMNPHFIFNSLSSIDNLVQTDQKERATTYLAKFARLIRAILEYSKHEVIPCWKDMETLQLYLELENLRWDKKFATEIKIDEKIVHGDYKIPPMLIQPYVENAIRHGLLNKKEDDRKLKISVNAENGSIKYVIEDNGVGREQAEVYNKMNSSSHQSMGMNITQQRIHSFNNNTDGSIKISDLYNHDRSAAGTRVEILINNQV